MPCLSSGACDWEQGLLWRTAAPWEECQNTRTLCLQVFQELSPSFILPQHWDTLTQRWMLEQMSLCSLFWSSTSRQDFWYPRKNIKELVYSEFRTSWPGDLVTLSYYFQNGNHSLLKKSVVLFKTVLKFSFVTKEI